MSKRRNVFAFESDSRRAERQREINAARVRQIREAREARAWAVNVIQRFARRVVRRNHITELPVETDHLGRPISVTVRADRIGNPETILEDLRRFLAQRVVQRVVGYNPDRRIRGLLVVTNTETGASRVAVDGELENEFRGQAGFGGLNIQTMHALQEKLGRSSEEIDQLNLEWTFQIIWPEVVGAKTKPPNGLLYGKKDPWKRLWDTPEDLSCLAYSLVHLMSDYRHLFDIKTRDGLGAARKKTLALMMKMGWGKNVSLYEGCEQFVKEYGAYEVVVVTMMSLKTKATRVYTGENFVPKVGKDGEYLADKKRLYLFHDIQNNHVAGTPSVNALCRRVHSSSWKWCFKCHYCYNNGWVTHICDGEDEVTERIINKVCPKCNETYIVGDHNCPLVRCATCTGDYFKYDVVNRKEAHRCISFQPPSKEEHQVWNTELEPDGKVPAALAYDFETFIRRVPCPRENIAEFNYDNDGHFLKGDNGFVKQTVMEYEEHVVNWISCTDMMTRETKVFRYNRDDDLEDPMKRFVSYVTCEYNKGFNTLVAHNAKSYDAILLANFIYNNIKKKTVSMVRRGRKILQLKISKKGCRTSTTFIDSLTHCPGSLAGLYKAFCGGALTKGYYPYTFNTPEHYGYIGVLPEKKHYGIYERAKSKKDIDAFEKWWEEERARVGDRWNYEEESQKYSVEDTEGLATVMKVYHDICMDKFKMTPWKCMTGPSFRHKISLELVTKMLFDKYQNEHGVDLYELMNSDKQAYANVITELAKTETWAVLKPLEYAPVRAAMRGGRTECFQMHAQLTQEEINNGVRFRHVDITSSYPAQQIRQQYPVGLPEMKIYDREFAPCTHETCRNSCTRTSCKHPEQMRNTRDHKYSKLYSTEDQPTAQQVLDEEWSGYACVTMQPCKMPIMIVGVYDEKAMKNVYTAERIEKLWLPCCTLLTALKWGYKLEMVHSYHKYNMKDSLFRDDTLPLFVQKTVNSSPNPTAEEREALAKLYDEKFDTEFGDAIRDSGEWAVNLAVKMVYKILLNCGWGKHAQQPRMNETKVIDERVDNGELNTLLDNVVRGTQKVSDVQNVGAGVRTFSVEKTDLTAPDLHGTYLPAGAMVPAFGQLQLWNEMNRIEMSNLVGGGKRVVYCDTDSIIYKWYPESYGLYNVPENDSLLGGWTREDPPEKGGIVGFAAIGPKTYAYKYHDGSYSSMKTKGVTVGYASENILNFETVSKHVQLQMKYIREDKEKADGKIRKVNSIGVPQTNFFVRGTGIITHRSIKKIGVNLTELKGVMLDTGEMVPFGLGAAPEQEVVVSGWSDYIF
jgi:DNA polymerase type B, organellar and viral